VTSPTSKEDQEKVIPTKKEKTALKNSFLSSTIDEMKLVVWPSRQQLFSESIAVILMVTLSAVSIAAVSLFYGWASTQIFR
jgi:preprotein translocase subunit SecE